MAPVLNLNNEVVKMRKDVKKVKVLTIRKLTRHIAKLKAKKGTEELLLKNQRRAQRLLEEIHAIKELRPDDVTKTALQKEIDFDKVCKKPNSTATNRAIARLAMNPSLKHKISAIKEAVKAFKEARKSNPEGDSDVKQDSKQPECVQNISTITENKCNQVKAKGKRKAEQTKPQKENTEAQECKRMLVAPDCTAEKPGDRKENISAQENVQEQTSSNDIEVQVEAVDGMSAPVKSASTKNTSLVPPPVSDSSDIEDSDTEDKEYFDDSTEERFCKQSSGFEDSDSDGSDDFFIGKVRQTKKKKSDKNSECKGKKESSSQDKAKSIPADSNSQKWNRVPGTAKLQSAFCKSLSDTKPKASYVKRETNLPFVKNKKAVAPPANKLMRKPIPNKGQASFPRSKPQAPEQSLHPSWEASRRRKQQMSQITAFQGKKITFDD
ncbi:serum response factor-binding protein 1 [Spea bombifrons]|uniref:serum response factor-binding protein 1 n=1 Tax=Spea bombifrons TaxID=233779 RepID=UPI00234A3C4C|nr:serum response factor-binding protein 1 [Spea bombifrons]